MPKYRYTVVNKENKQLIGTINAGSEDMARRELNALNFSILNITEINEENPKDPEFKKSLPKFEFAAFDKNGKKIIGSVPAGDRYLAFKKLKEEYNFKILYIHRQDLTPEEKSALELKGVSELEALYLKEKEQQQGLNQKNQQISQKSKDLEKEFMAQQVKLMITKSKELIQKFESNLVPQKIQAIKDQISKILRIKESANLNYIKESCKELIKLLENDDLINNKVNNRLYIKKTILFQTKKLKFNLDRNYIRSFNIVDSLKQQMDRINATQENPSFPVKILYPILLPLIKFFDEDEEITILKQEIKQINTQVFDYIRIWLTADKELKEEALTSLKEILITRKKLKKEIKTRKILIQEQKKLSRKTNTQNNFIMELNLFTGWLLSFYLIYYFISSYFLTKNFNLNLSWNFQLFNSALLKYLITFVFLLHSSTSLKINWLKENKTADFIVFPISGILFLLIIFNL